MLEERDTRALIEAFYGIVERKEEVQELAEALVRKGCAVGCEQAPRGGIRRYSGHTGLEESIKEALNIREELVSEGLLSLGFLERES